MTFAEVLARVQWNIWGNTIPPANAVAMLQGANGIISRAHHMIQNEHNFWFMQTWAEIATIYDEETEEYTQAYLVENYKEIIAVSWHTVDEEGNNLAFTKPLAQLTLEQAQTLLWPQDNWPSVEYPEYFEMVNDTIVFYPDGNCSRTAVVNYWQFIECDLDGEDALMREGPEAVIRLATSEMYLQLHEVELSQYWRGLYEDAMEKFRSKDFHKRRAHIQEFGTQEGM